MSMHIVFMISKYIIYVLLDFRDQIPLRKINSEQKILDIDDNKGICTFQQQDHL